MESKITYTYRKSNFSRFTGVANDRSTLSTLHDFLSFTEQENYTNCWSKCFHKSQLYQCANSPTFSPKPFRGDAELLKFIEEVLVSSTNNNIASVLSVTQREDRMSLIDIVYLTPKHTLHDVLTYSPAVLQNSVRKIQFIIYQLLQCQHYLHSKGTLLGSISLKDIYVDEFLWISVCPKFCEEFSCPPVGAAQDVDSFVVGNSENDPPDRNLTSMTNKWVKGLVSNFDYLMFVNECCGRVLGHPNHHPVLPWIMDFSQPLGGWRDLTKSKFRINKGDDQLDQTYEVARHILSETSEDVAETSLKSHSTKVHPHHISDVLSDITYYTYKARRTPKEILCQFVRQKWVPHEYPSSVRRLQEWTPDECIPEFYTDPAIFQSIHDDLPDLEIPTWAQSPDDFVEQHRVALESDSVSRHLHHWIDLTFGVKLSGEAAVQAKNVCLALVDEHTTYTDHGIVQLFTKPHPEKIGLSNKYISSRPPDILYKTKFTHPEQRLSNESLKMSDTDPVEIDDLIKQMDAMNSSQIQLPPDFDPLELLGRVEKDPPIQPPSKKCKCNECPYHRDTLYLGCLIAQIVLPLHTRALTAPQSLLLDDYVDMVRKIVIGHKYTLPSALYSILETVLEIKAGLSSSVSGFPHPHNLPPVTASLLLAPPVLSMPPYFPELFRLLSAHVFTAQLLCHSATSPGEAEQELKARLAHHTHFITNYGHRLCEEGVNLYVPFIIQLLSQKSGDYCVQSLWSVFSPLSQILGKDFTYHHLSPYITPLYTRDDVSSFRKVKLYHRTFIQQLVTQFGLQNFLEDYSSALVLSLYSLPSSGEDGTVTGYSSPSVNPPAISAIDLATILRESILWLAGRVGPLLTAKYLTSRILQSMKECYEGEGWSEEQTGATDELVSLLVTGDLLLLPAVTCLQEISFLYGEQFILLQYIPSVIRVVESCDTAALLPSSAASLLSVCTMLLYLIPCLTDGALLDLMEMRLITEILLPLIAIISNPRQCFPSSRSPTEGSLSRRLLALRVLDLIILISQRIGYDQTRRFLNRPLQAFFRSFEIVHSESESWSQSSQVSEKLSSREASRDFLEVKQSVTNANEFYIGTQLSIASPAQIEIHKSTVSPDVLKELEHVFTIELAHKAYIQCCRLVGGIYIKELTNDDLIRRLCAQYEEECLHRLRGLKQTEACVPQLDYSQSDISAGNQIKTTNWFIPVPLQTPPPKLSSSPFEIVSGNKLTYNHSAHEQKTTPPISIDTDSKYPAISSEKLKRPDMELLTTRHLKGDWIAYWEHELGHSRDKAALFDFKQIGLQTFTGHVGLVKSLSVLDNENSLVSGGKDRTVRLWSLRNTGSGSARCTPQFTYSEHKKPVFFATFMDSVKQMVSCDGSIHVWDTMTGALLSQYECTKPAVGFSAVQTVQSFLSDHLIAAATPDSAIRFIDIRQDQFAHEFRVPSFSSGSIAGLVLGSTWIAVAHTTGSICVLDFRTGFILASWMCRSMESDLTQMTGYNHSQFITCSMDGHMALWNHNSSTPTCQTKLTYEQQVSSIQVYNKAVITASQANRVSTYQPYIYEGNFRGTLGDKLRPEVFKGTLTSMCLLPLNRQLVLGSDSGTIHLVA